MTMHQPSPGSVPQASESYKFRRVRVVSPPADHLDSLTCAGVTGACSIGVVTCCRSVDPRPSWAILDEGDRRHRSDGCTTAEYDSWPPTSDAVPG